MKSYQNSILTIEELLPQQPTMQSLPQLNNCSICSEPCEDPRYCRCKPSRPRIHHRCLLQLIKQLVEAGKAVSCRSCHLKYHVQYEQKFRPQCRYLCKQAAQQPFKFICFILSIGVLLGYLLYYSWLMVGVASNQSNKILVIVTSIFAVVAVAVLLSLSVLWCYDYMIDTHVPVKVAKYAKRRIRENEQDILHNQ